VQYGDQGQNVRRMQEALVAAGYHGVGETDGHFGHAMDAAVRYYQAVNQLPITGQVDEAMALALGVSLAEHDAGAAGQHPVIALTNVRYSNGALDCEFMNHGTEAHGYVTYHFEGAQVHTFQDTAHFLVGEGAVCMYYLPTDLPPGPYRVTVYANVTDANPQGDDQHELEFEHSHAQ